ncbi:MAG: NADH-quinone oxidoreductase subunit K [Holosporales bacterium]|jgi:NADH:ubiquinone oxidoreductase subunit K|nr:NADH-quinone oxidoreductase subunit K [Holosporales bacterium]
MISIIKNGAMNEKDIVLIVSGLLFCAGIIGLLRERKIIKILISIEIILISSILNFCYFSYGMLLFGYIVAAVVLAIGGATFCIIFSLCCIQFKNNEKDIDNV